MAADPPPILDYRRPPVARRPAARVVAATLSACFTFVATAMVMGCLIGQSFDGIEGWWQIIPAFGTWAVAIGLAVIAFRRSYRRRWP